VTDVKISERQSLLVQSHAFLECCVRLGRLEEEGNPIFADSIYGDTSKWMSSRGHSTFKGPGFLISAFYALLVLPLEWKKQEVDSFEQLDLSKAEDMANRMAILRSPEDDTYEFKKMALGHLRNALAHGRIGWSHGNLVVEDCDKSRGYSYRAEYSMVDLGELAQCLSLAISEYVQYVTMSKQAT